MQQDRERQQQTQDRPTRSRTILVLRVYVFIIVGLFIYVYFFDAEWLGISTKTVWDWLVLLLPAAVATASLFWQTQRTFIDKREPGFTDKRAQDEALQEYLDQMAQLLLERDLRTSASDSEVRYVARAQRLTILDRLNVGPEDAHRKRRIIQFLYELRLIQGPEPIVGLHAADLSNADLHELELSRVNLRGVDLTGAIGVTNEQLEQQAFSLKGATMPDGSRHD